MIKDQLDTFTDRQEAIALFNRVYERRPGEPWPLLPILSLVGPAGCGKSQLIRQLYFHYCAIPHLPHASLDFGRPGAPHDMLDILGALRNSLRRQRDEHGHALTFPRFDIIFSRLKRSEGLEDKDEVAELFGDFSDLIGLLGNIHIALGLFLYALKFITRIPLLRTMLRKAVGWAYQRAGGRPQWRWYQDQVKKFRELNLSHHAPIEDILTRLNEMCIMGGPERDFLIEQILPKAFLADLRYGAHDDEAAMLANGPQCIAIFLDSFEVLQRSADATATLLLEALALNEYRKRGETDPLLLIVGSEDRLPAMSHHQLNQHIPLTTTHAEGGPQERANMLYEQWRQQLPTQDRHSLRDIYLPLPLPSLSLAATRDFLLNLDQYNATYTFANEALIEDIYHTTQGYPVFLERVATALQASTENSGTSFQDSASLLASEQGEQIVDRLLASHCKQVDEQSFMICAIPRSLNPELLSLLLDLSDKRALTAELERLRQLPFLLFSEDRQRITFVSGIRALFLQKLQRTAGDSDSDYLRIHQRLYDYYTARGKQEHARTGAYPQQDLLERCYHALALGNHQVALDLVSNAYPDLPFWENLLQVVAEAPIQQLRRDEVERLASESLYQLRRHTTSDKAQQAIVLYTWLLVSPGSDRKHVSSLWYNLGTAYQYLQDIDPRVPRDKATMCFQHADALLDTPAPITQPLTPSVSGQLAANHHPSFRPRMSRFAHGIYRALRTNRGAQIILSVVLLCAIIASLLITRVQPSISVPTNTSNPFSLSLSEFQPGAHSGWIGATVEPDKEFVGLSDGSIPFDYLRPDGSLKILAANQIHRGNITGARSTLQQAVQSDVNDAEAWIYLQNTQALLSGKTCTTFVIATRIIEDTSEGVNNGRDNLQGAYVAQQEYNETHVDTPICLYVANMGINAGYEPLVAQQIIKAATASHNAIKALVGWPGLFDSSSSLTAVHLLEKAHLPIVSPDSYDEIQFVSNVFHVAPSSQDQGRQAALYAEHVLHKTRAAIIADPSDPYSRCLAEGFLQRFEEDNNHVVSIQPYSTGHTDASTLVADLQTAITSHPDFIYYAGGIDAGSVLLAQLGSSSSSLPLLGGDKLYPFIGFSANARPGFDRLAFTSAAYSDAPASKHMKALYTLDFDAHDPDHVREYGYSRPDSDAILSYDAMETLIAADTNAAGLHSLQAALPATHVVGASRQHIAFTSLNELDDQALFMLYIDHQEQIRFSVI